MQSANQISVSTGRGVLVQVLQNSSGQPGRALRLPETHSHCQPTSLLVSSIRSLAKIQAVMFLFLYYGILTRSRLLLHIVRLIWLSATFIISHQDLNRPQF